MHRSSAIVISSKEVIPAEMSPIFEELDLKVKTLPDLDDLIKEDLRIYRTIFLLDPELEKIDSSRMWKLEGRCDFTAVFSEYSKGVSNELIRLGLEDFILLTDSIDEIRDRIKLALRARNHSLMQEQILQQLERVQANSWAVLDTIVDGIVTIDDRGTITSMNRASEILFGYSATEVIGQNVNCLMPHPYKAEHDSYLKNYKDTGHRKIIGIGREVVGARKDGSTFPMELSVSEVIVNDERTFTGVVRDISNRRDLERRLVDNSEQERRAVGQDLHDGLGQVLTAISLISQNIASRLREEESDLVDDVLDIVKRVKTADQHLRLLVRGLMPVQFGSAGFLDALKSLARDTEKLSGIPCSFKLFGREPGSLNGEAATHLYRIAQEATHNAVRHSKGSVIALIVAVGEKHIRLRIQDNGVGFSKEALGKSGLGMHTMSHRAQLIGASFDIKTSKEEGTTITCTYAHKATSENQGTIK